MIKWIAGRIHAAWLDACYDWITVECPGGRWEVHPTDKVGTSSRITYWENEDKAEAFIDRHCAHAAAVFVVCFWRRKP